MSEPESHTLRLLGEFRREFSDYRKEFKAFRDETNVRFHETNARFDQLTRLFAGESVLGRYAAAGVEERLHRLKSASRRWSGASNASRTAAFVSIGQRVVQLSTTLAEDSGSSTPSAR